MLLVIDSTRHDSCPIESFDKPKRSKASLSLSSKVFRHTGGRRIFSLEPRNKTLSLATPRPSILRFGLSQLTLMLLLENKSKVLPVCRSRCELSDPFTSRSVFQFHRSLSHFSSTATTILSKSDTMGSFVFTGGGDGGGWGSGEGFANQLT